MISLKDAYTSTGHKFFAHQEAMTKLRNGQGQPITCHIMSTDICNHTCAFCSVQARAGDVLPFDDIMGFVDILVKFGLKSCILSGGGNPILYKCKVTGKNFNDLVDAIYERGLEIGLITNGMPMRQFEFHPPEDPDYSTFRESWGTVRPETLDKLKWVRISMSGLDHVELEVFVPDIDPDKTTLGFSYVAHDIYKEPADPYHRKVSRPLDILSGDKHRHPDRAFEDRMEWLVARLGFYAATYGPRYIRLLPNCLEPSKIDLRCKQLQCMADEINDALNREVVFVQHKPPKAPHACYLGYVHPVLNSDGFVYPCDSCVLNEAAGHSFANPWRVCHWSEIATLYDKPVRSLISDPAKLCPGCVFFGSNEILGEVVDGTADITPLVVLPEHHNFV